MFLNGAEIIRFGGGKSVVCPLVNRAWRIVVPLYEDRKYIEIYNFRNVQESGLGQINRSSFPIFLTL